MMFMKDKKLLKLTMYLYAVLEAKMFLLKFLNLNREKINMIYLILKELIILCLKNSKL